jgi:hypothetical protein
MVNIVRHLNLYPNETLISALDNVFHFDSYDYDLRTQLASIFLKHGISLGMIFILFCLFLCLFFYFIDVELS